MKQVPILILTYSCRWGGKNIFREKSKWRWGDKEHRTEDVVIEVHSHKEWKQRGIAVAAENSEKQISDTEGSEI